MAKSIHDLDANSRDLLTTSMAWADVFWDESVGLLWSPGDVADVQHPEKTGMHTVRDTTWYALGLLLRNGAGDTSRAARALDAVLGYQFDEPDQPYHGAFYRAPEEPHPPLAAATEWRTYDPNWREFIMTTVAILLDEYKDRLPPSLVRRIDATFAKAIEGALARGLKPTYTNIALMNAFMLWFAGTRFRQTAWVEAGESMATEIHRLFTLHGAFEEYNSPTYYGVDIYALAQWRAYATSPILRDLGAQMEALLWTDIARHYHAGLRNICGPYDRSYGMDMRRYAAVIGEWIWLATGKQQAPFPDPAGRFAHAHDFLFAPAAAILGAQVPPDARAHFLAFQGERQVERMISGSPRRVATAWLGNDIMIGAEHTSGSRRGSVQFHPATMHWRVGADDVGWMRLVHSEPVDCRGSKNRLEIAGRGGLVFGVCAPGLHPDAVRAGLWRLPDLTVSVETTIQTIRVEQTGDQLRIRYVVEAGEPVALTLYTNAGG